MRAFKVMREVKYCTVQLLLQVVLNVASYACIAVSSVPEFNALATSAHRRLDKTNADVPMRRWLW